MKWRDLSCDYLIGSTSRPYNRSVYILWAPVGESFPPMQYICPFCCI